MPISKKWLAQKEAASRARAAAWEARQAKKASKTASVPSPAQTQPLPQRVLSPIVVDSESEDSDCVYMGGVNYYGTSDDKGDSLGSQDELDNDESLEEFDKEDIAEMEKRAGLYTQLQAGRSVKEWKKIESNRTLGYNGQSARSRRRHKQEGRERKEQREKARISTDPQVVLMHSFFAPKPPVPAPEPIPLIDSGISGSHREDEAIVATIESFAEFSRFSSDEEDSETDGDADDEREEEDENVQHTDVDPEPVHAEARKRTLLPVAPPRKHHRHIIPVRTQRQIHRDEKMKQWKIALDDIQKKIRSKKTNFVGGPAGLQAYRTRAIESLLVMVVRNGRLSVDAAEHAAESHEFFWGSVKRYLREHCDMTFETLKTNMPLALASVQLATIRRWELRIHRWMNAYRDGLGTVEAQARVKAFSSKKYKSHRRVPETLARTFDT